MYVCIYMYVYAEEYYLALMKKEILPFVTTWMNPEHYTKWSPTKRNMYGLIYMQKLKKNTKNLRKTENIIVNAKGVGEMQRCWSKGLNVQS